MALELKEVTAKINAASDIQFTEAEVLEKLKSVNMSLETLTEPMLEQWIIDGVGTPENPKGRGRKKGGGLAKTEQQDAIATQPPAQPPAPQTPPPAQDLPPFEEVDLGAALDPVMNRIAGVGANVVNTTNDQINYVVGRVLEFAQSAPDLTARRIAQGLGASNVQDAGGLIQIQDERWGNSLAFIDRVIENAKAS